MSLHASKVACTGTGPLSVPISWRFVEFAALSNARETCLISVLLKRSVDVDAETPIEIKT